MRLMNTTALFSAALLLACGTDTGNGIVSVKPAVTSSEDTGSSALSSVATIVGKDAQGTALTIEAARANVRHVEFMRPGGKQTCEDYKPSNNERIKCDGGKIRVNGPFAVDLLNAHATPPLDDLDIAPDTYMRVDVRFEDAHASDGVVTPSDPLESSTIIASGTLAYPQGSTTLFDFALKFTEDARFESPEGIRIDGDTSTDVLLWLDVAKWFSTVPITQCIESGALAIADGHIKIEDKGVGPCSMIEGGLRDMIKTSGSLDEDE